MKEIYLKDLLLDICKDKKKSPLIVEEEAIAENIPLAIREAENVIEVIVFRRDLLEEVRRIVATVVINYNKFIKEDVSRWN